MIENTDIGSNSLARHRCGIVLLVIRTLGRDGIRNCLRGIQENRSNKGTQVCHIRRVQFTLHTSCNDTTEETSSRSIQSLLARWCQISRESSSSLATYVLTSLFHMRTIGSHINMSQLAGGSGMYNDANFCFWTLSKKANRVRWSSHSGDT